MWICLACAGTALQAQTAQRIYELNNSYTETNGGSNIEPNGGPLSATGYSFALAQGLTARNALANTGEYSIEMIARIDNVSGMQNLFNFNDRSANPSIYSDNGSISFIPYAGGKSPSVDFVSGRTYRIVITRNASTKVTTAYVDGQQKAQVTDTGDHYVASGPAGVLHFFRDDVSENAAGYIDQIRIYHSVLTPSQVAGLNVLRLASWQAVVNAGSPAVTHYVPVLGTNPTNMSVGNFAAGSARSFEFVFNAAGAGPSKTLLGSAAVTGGVQALKFNQFNNTGKFGVTKFGVADDVFANSPTLSNQDVHAVFTSNGSVTTLYLNGVAQSGTINQGLSITGSQFLGAYIAGNFDNSPADNLDGTINGFASYGRALTPQEVSARYSVLYGTGSLIPPVVTAPTIAGITGTSATLGGSVASDTTSTLITERGVIYSVFTVNSDPVIGGSGVTKITTPGTTGVFTINAGNLLPGTDYAFKAYAINSQGTSYTNLGTFRTSAANSFTSLVPWRAVVNADSPAATYFTSVAGSSPVIVNVGNFATGSARSFEFVFNAVGAGPSKTLLGSELVASGAQYLKLNQFNNTGKFGMTTAGVADSVFANSPTISSEDVHAVFTSNGSVTTLYLNGVAQTGTINSGLRITGNHALGAIQRITAPLLIDNLDGAILGFASYGRALTPAEVATRYNALLNSNNPPIIFAASDSVSTPAGVAPTMSGGFFDPEGNATVTLTANVGTVIQNNAAGTWTWTGPIGNGASTSTIIITATDTGSGGLFHFARFTSTITDVDPVTITTPTSASITAITATLGGNVVSDGGGAISERGVVFSRTTINADPLIDGAGVTKITTTGTTGVFTTDVINLTPGTQYSFKAYAINFAGTTYTSVATFSTLSNNPPVVAVNSPSTVSTPEGTTPTKSGTFSDAQGNASVTLTSSSGTIVQNNTAGTWVWTGPVSNEPGSSTVTITATDTQGAIATASFTSIITNVDPATITAPTSASIGETTAVLGGNVTSDGGDVITERGVVYAVTATNANPLIGGAGVTKLTASGTTGVFTINASGLTVQTSYSFKAYAINSLGISYTSVATFTTLASLAPWRAVVLAGGPAATYDIPVSGGNPVIINVGNLILGPRSFEFVFTAIGAGPSKTLLGSQISNRGAQALKLNQFNNTGKFGITTFGVGDFVFANSPTISNQPVHAVFTSNGSVTTLYLNGVVQSGTINQGLRLSATQALGAYQRVTGPTFEDNLDGTIFGFASYARALTQEEVTARYNALSGFVPIASPGVTAPTIADITETTVTLGGNVVNDRGAPITERGVIYSATMNNADPVIGGPGVTKITVSGTTGVFTTSVTNLTELTRYSFKAYAINSEGVSYSSLATFTTLYDTELWQAVVEAGNPAVIYYVPTDGANPVSINVGDFAIGSPRSFEFVFTAAGAGPSKTLLGDESGNSGAQYLKVNQFNNTGKFGISTPGVADDVFADSPTLSNQMVHAVFASNGSVTTLYLNGVAQPGTINRGLRITGTNGLGAFRSIDALTFRDNLDGTISGFASYARALTPQEVTARYNSLVGILPVEPSFVTTPSSAAITGTSATLGGRVVSDYGAAITERGVVYSMTTTNADPVIGGPGVTKITASGTTGIFTTSAINLTELTGYSFKAYAVNSRGIAYTSVSTFLTLADIAPWRALVNADNPTTTYHLTVNGNNPVSVNVGDFAIGSPRSFEFVFNAAGAGASRTLLGSESAFAGAQYLKLNQFNNSGKFGLTTRGIADDVFDNSPTISNQRVHAVFTSNGSETMLYLNGIAQSGIIYRGLQNTFLNGLGAILRSNFSDFEDNLDGSIFGFASYGRALTQAEVTARHTALLQTPPIVTTPTSTDITATTATLGGDVVGDGGVAITERGVVYSVTATNADPLIDGSGVTKITASGTTGVFTANAINLSALTGYSFKAYAVNSNGTTYTTVATFSTLANPASGYAGWVAAEGLTGADAQPTAQPFGDGLANVLKYAFNMPLDGPRSNLLNPTAGPGANGLPVFTQQLTGPNPTFRVQFLRRINSDLNYVPQWSTNLTSPFTPMLADEVVTPIDAEWERVTVDESLGLPLPPTFFGRVKVTLP